MYLFRSPIFNFLSNLYYGEVKETTATGAYTMLVIYVLLYIISFFAYGGTRYASESTEIMGNAVSDDDEWEDKDFYGLRNILLLLAMVYAFAPMHNYVTRIGYPLGLYMSLYIPKLIDGFEVTPKWLYNAVCILILVGCFLSRSVGSLGTLPFSFG
ncbi:MAG: hypothetical protein LIP01_16250, partial [Tannerellaceae bacterium]|nr:hypothetical protein [Tannerellaceae bacterium]